MEGGGWTGLNGMGWMEWGGWTGVNGMGWMHLGVWTGVGGCVYLDYNSCVVFPGSRVPGGTCQCSGKDDSKCVGSAPAHCQHAPHRPGHHPRQVCGGSE